MIAPPPPPLPPRIEGSGFSRRSLGTSIFVMVCIVLIALVMVRMSTGSEDGDTLGPEVIVPVAARHAEDTGSVGLQGFGGIIGEPAAVQGTMMTLTEAEFFTTGQPISEGSEEWENRSALVWLVAFDGAIRGEADSEYRQLSIVLDARTRRLISSTAYPAGNELDTSGLEDLRQYMP